MERKTKKNLAVPIRRIVCLRESFPLFEGGIPNIAGDSVKNCITLNTGDGIEFTAEISTLPVEDPKFKGVIKHYLPFASSPMEVVTQSLVDSDNSTIVAIVRGQHGCNDMPEIDLQQELARLRFTVEFPRNAKFLREINALIEAAGNGEDKNVKKVITGFCRSFGYYAEPILNTDDSARAEFRDFLPFEHLPEIETGIFSIPRSTLYFSQITGRFVTI